MRFENFEEKLYFWIKLGTCRQAELARQLGVTRQYVNNALNTNITLSKDQEERFVRAMSRVEKRESSCKSKVESNILKCSKNYHSEYARERLEHWISVYRGFA